MLRRTWLALSAAAPIEAAWSGFRGDSRTGSTAETIPAELWSDGGLELLWRRPIGPGYSSVAVGGGRAYSAELRENQQTVFAFDPASGEEFWSYGWKARFGSRRGLVSTIVRSGKGPRSTPTWDGGAVYAVGPAGQVVSLDDATGEPRWRRSLQQEIGAKGPIHGVASSPLLLDDLVVLAPGRADDRTIVALDRATGELRWGALSEAAAYVSPMVAVISGNTQLIAGSQTRVVGLEPRSGRLLWQFAWKTNDWAAQPLPLPGNGLLLAGGSECARIDIVNDGDGFEAREVWRNINLKAGYSSPVSDGSFIFGLDKSFLTCLSPRTGERHWKGGRYGRGQVILSGSGLIVLSEDGELARVSANEQQHKETARFRAVEGPVYAGPALSSGRLFVRGARELACFGASAGEPGSAAAGHALPTWERAVRPAPS